MEQKEMDNKKLKMQNNIRLRRWRAKNPEKNRVMQKKYKEKNPEIVKKIKKKYAKNNPKKVRARNKARYIKIPKNQLCQICKIKLAKEKHHEDYDKPLEVMFLCGDCHRKTTPKPLKKDVQEVSYL